jgi:DNA-directed RNA polymerase beta subunit
LGATFKEGPFLAEMDPRCQAVLAAYFESHPRFATRHNIDAFDSFISAGLRAIVAKAQIYVLKPQHEIRVRVGGADGSDIRILQPTRTDGTPMTPHAARLDNLDYVAEVRAGVSIEYKSASTGGVVARHFKDVKVAAIPCMVRSALCTTGGADGAALRAMGECPLDHGGYFIVGGKEKVIVAQERAAANVLVVETVPPPAQGPPKHSVVGTARCISPKDPFPRTLRLFLRSHEARERPGAIEVELPRVKRLVPLCLLFRALGVETDEGICNAVLSCAPACSTRSVRRCWTRWRPSTASRRRSSTGARPRRGRCCWTTCCPRPALTTTARPSRWAAWSPSCCAWRWAPARPPTATATR